VRSSRRRISASARGNHSATPKAPIIVIVAKISVEVRNWKVRARVRRATNILAERLPSILRTNRYAESGTKKTRYRFMCDLSCATRYVEKPKKNPPAALHQNESTTLRHRRYVDQPESGAARSATTL